MTSASSMPSHGARTVFFYRLLLVASGSVVLGGTLALVLFLTALVSREAFLGRAAEIALSVSVLGQAFYQACVAWWLRRSGSWRGLSGEWLSRDQHPQRFKVWLMMHVVLAVIFSAAAASLTGIAVGS